MHFRQCEPAPGATIMSSSTAHDVLRAIGTDPASPASSAPLPCDLQALARLLSENNLNLEAVRDRNGTTALGVAAFLGRIAAMKLLLEHGANPAAENLDGASCLSMAVFGKSAEAVAMLLVYGGDDLETADATADARVVNDRATIEVLNEWHSDKEITHPLLSRAADMFDESEPIMIKANEASRAGKGASADEGGRTSATRNDWKARAEAAEAKVEELMRRLQVAEAALAAAQRGALGGLKLPSFRMPHGFGGGSQQQQQSGRNHRNGSKQNLLRMMGLGRNSEKSLPTSSMNGIGQVRV